MPISGPCRWRPNVQLIEPELRIIPETSLPSCRPSTGRQGTSVNFREFCTTAKLPALRFTRRRTTPEIRSPGMGSPLKLARGKNELWTKGGLLFTSPFQ